MASKPKKPNHLSISRTTPFEESQDLFSCSYPQCDYKSNWEENVGRHEESHSSSGNWNIPCQVCPQVFGFLVSFLYHMSSQHSDKLFCPWCLFLGRDLDEFKAHMLDHIPTPFNSSPVKTAKVTIQSSCGTCSKTFTRKRDLFRHHKFNSCKSNSSPATSKAEIYNYSQSSFENSKQKKLNLFAAKNEDGQQLLKSALTTSRFLCGNCSKTFKFKVTLVQHQKNSCKSKNPAGVGNQNRTDKIVKVQMALLSCDKCSYKTSRPSNLHTHSRIHSSVKRFACQNLGCIYKTHWAQCLQRHQQTCRYPIQIPAETSDDSIVAVGKTKSEKPGEIVMRTVSVEGARYSCGICSFSSKWKPALMKHLTVNKHLSCQVKGYKYRSKWPHNLNSSKIVHRHKVSKASQQMKQKFRPGKELETETKVDVNDNIGSSMAFACMLCDFIGDSESAALKHARQHKTLVISLNRI